MLQAIRTEGSKPPLFMVHGIHGIMAIAHPLGRALGADQPLYGLHANGIDGAGPQYQSMEEMLAGHLAKIRAVRPRGPYVMGGVCAGTLVAMELARTLTGKGERVGRVVLVDPPSIPAAQIVAVRNMSPQGDPGVRRHLHDGIDRAFRNLAQAFGELPFDVNNPVQMERAIEVGMQTMVVMSSHAPPRFDGSTECIVSAERAFAHLHPQGPWRQLVSAIDRMHVIPGNHSDLFEAHLDEVLRLVRFALDSAFDG